MLNESDSTEDHFTISRLTFFLYSCLALEAASQQYHDYQSLFCFRCDLQSNFSSNQVSFQASQAQETVPVGITGTMSLEARCDTFEVQTGRLEVNRNEVKYTNVYSISLYLHLDVFRRFQLDKANINFLFISVCLFHISIYLSQYIHLNNSLYVYVVSLFMCFLLSIFGRISAASCWPNWAWMVRIHRTRQACLAHQSWLS